MQSRYLEKEGKFFITYVLRETPKFNIVQYLIANLFGILSNLFDSMC